MNNHLPYRNWIFNEAPLPTDSGRALRLHLQQCPECRALAEGWEAARQSLETAEQKIPPEGFSARWKALAKKRLRTPNPRPAWVLLGASSLGSLALAAALAVQTSGQGLSLAGVVTHDITAAAGTLDKWLDTSNAVGGFLNIVFRSIPPACYLFAVFFLSLLGILWLLLFVRMNSRGAKR